MNKVLFAVLFSVLLLIPIGAQQVFANHPQLACPPPGILITDPSLFAGSAGITFCLANVFDLPNPASCTPPYIPSIVFSIAGASTTFTACVLMPQTTPDPTHQDQCQDKATLVGNHCVPDLSQVCGSGTIPQNLMCFAQTMGSMIGGELLDINTVSLLVASIGVNPVITGLVGITIAGVAAQAVWFVHRRKKKVE